MGDLETLLGLAGLFVALGTAGAVCGYVAGLVRSGGGALLAPVFWIVFSAVGVEPAAALAVGSALAVQAMLSARALAARGGLAAAEPGLLRVWAPAAALGAPLAAVVAFLLPERALLGILGAALFLLGLRAAFAGRPAVSKSGDAAAGGALGAGAAALAAFLGALTGQGAGTLGPATLSLLGARSDGPAVHGALAAAATIWTALAAVGFLAAGLFSGGATLGPFLSIGWINLAALAAATPLWIAAAPHGARLAEALGPTPIGVGFALMMTALGLVLIRSAGIG